MAVMVGAILEICEGRMQSFLLTGWSTFQGAHASRNIFLTRQSQMFLPGRS